MSSTANHKVEFFEIPADNVENLKNFILRYLHGNLKKAKLKATG
jgi:hypothetical protein